MKLIKLAFLSLVTFFVLVTVISLFIPSDLRVSKAVNIAAPKERVYQQVGSLSQWPAWFPVLSVSGVESPRIIGNDSIFVGGTGIRIDHRSADSILFSMRSESGREVKGGFQVIHIAQQDSVTVQWFMNFKLSWYPWEKFSSLFYESLYGTQMEKGLARLKELEER